MGRLSDQFSNSVRQDMEWYYESNGQQMGPVSADQIKQMLSYGTIQASTLVWKEGMADWEPLRTSPLQQELEAPLYADAENQNAGTAPPAPPAPGQRVCAYSGQSFPETDMVQIGDLWVALPYRDAYLQRVQEGGSLQAVGGGGMGDTPNLAIREKARACIAGNLGRAIGAILVVGFVAGAVSIIPFAGGILQLVITAPLTLGLLRFFQHLARGEDANVGIVFEGFQQFGQAFTVYLLQAIFTFLWSLLLVIPGIMKALSYSMALRIASDHPGMGASDCIEKSIQMMEGSRMKLFKLSLSYFGWFILCFVLMIAGFAFVGISGGGMPTAILAAPMVVLVLVMYFIVYPRFYTAAAVFYDDVRGKADL